MKFLSIIQLTFRESLAKKTFIAFLAISTFICLLFIFALNVDIVDGLQSGVSIFGKDLPEQFDLTKIVIGIEGGLSVLLYTAGIFLSLFATSNLIPTMLKPGFVDLFLSKPVSRVQILAGRFIGSVLIVALNIFYLVIVSGLILSLKTGVWNWGFLWASVIIVLSFTVLFALMTFLSILSKNGPLSLMVTYLILFFSPLLLARDQIYALLSSKYYGYFFDGLYYVLPKTAELGAMTQRLARGLEVNSWMPLWSSLLFGLVMLGISAYIFQKKSF